MLLALLTEGNIASKFCLNVYALTLFHGKVSRFVIYNFLEILTTAKYCIQIDALCYKL